MRTENRIEEKLRHAVSGWVPREEFDRRMAEERPGWELDHNGTRACFTRCYRPEIIEKMEEVRKIDPDAELHALDIYEGTYWDVIEEELKPELVWSGLVATATFCGRFIRLRLE